MSERLRSLHAEMKKLCLEARVSEKTYDRILSRPELLSKLEEMYTNEFTSALRVKNLLPDEFWDRYKAFGLKNLREISMLRSALNKLKKAFYRIIPNESSDSIIEIEASASKLPS